MIAALTEMKHLLVKFGGHEAAAGFTIKTDRIGELATGLNRIASDQTNGAHSLPVVRADAELRMAEVNDRTFDSLGRMAPFRRGQCCAPVPSTWPACGRRGRPERR